MRILLVSDHYPPFIGGAHRQTQLLGQELSKRGHVVRVATVWHPGVSAQEEVAGVVVHRLKQLRTALPGASMTPGQRHQPPYPDPITAWALRRLINDFQPDVVHSHGWITYSASAALLGKSIPLLVSARDYGYSCPTRTLLYNDKPCRGPGFTKCMACATQHFGMAKGVVATLSILGGRRLLLRKTSGFHSVSRYVQEIIQRDLVGKVARPIKTVRSLAWQVISSFLIEGPGEAEPDLLRQLPATPYILFVGGLQLRKGLGTLLAAYQQLVAQRPAAPSLVLIGYDTPETPIAFPPGVIVLRNATHATVMRAWQRACFGVMPSLWPDPSPGVVREAMRMGKAMIGTNVGGTAELIDDGRTGLLVPPGDATALMQAMERLLYNPVFCAALGQAAQKQANRFMAEVAVPQFEQLYQELIGPATR